MTRLKFKNMVCDRCIMSVEVLLSGLNLKIKEIGLGYADLEEAPTESQMLAIKIGLYQVGFELIEDKESAIVESIKNAVIELIYKDESLLGKYTFSGWLEEKLDRDYKTLSQTFSAIENQTLEHYFIAQKIERVKELLSYGELNLSEIADKLSYSSVAHLSNQFKKVTGKTTSEFKNNIDRTSLDKI